NRGFGDEGLRFASPIGVIDERAHHLRIEIDRQALLHGVDSERELVIRIGRSLSRDGAKALTHGLSSDRFVVGLVVKECELKAWLRRLEYDRFMVWQRRFAPDAAVLGILVRKRAGDRPCRICV